MISFCDRDTVFAAIYQRVPILCIPMLEDQVDLARRVNAQGIGLTLNLSQLSPDSLIDNVHTIITTKRYFISLKGIILTEYTSFLKRKFDFVFILVFGIMCTTMLTC